MVLLPQRPLDVIWSSPEGWGMTGVVLLGRMVELGTTTGGVLVLLGMITGGVDVLLGMITGGVLVLLGTTTGGVDEVDERGGSGGGQPHTPYWTWQSKRGWQWSTVRPQKP